MDSLSCGFAKVAAFMWFRQLKVMRHENEKHGSFIICKETFKDTKNYDVDYKRFKKVQIIVSYFKRLSKRNSTLNFESNLKMEIWKFEPKWLTGK